MEVPRPSWNRTASMLIPTFLLLIVAFVSIALTPVTLSVERGVPKASLANGSWEEVPMAVPSTVAITAHGRGVTALAAPQLRWPEVFRRALVADSEKFHPDPNTGGFTSRNRGRLLFRGVFGSFSITLLARSTVKAITVTRRGNGFVRRLRVLPGESVVLESPERTFQRTTSFLWRSIPVRLDQPVTTGLMASIGNYEVNVGISQQLPFSVVAPKAFLLFLQGLLIFGASVALVVFGWAIIRSLYPTGPRSQGWLALQALAGVCLVALVANSLAYLIPTRWIGWFILSAGLLVITWRLIFHTDRVRTSFPLPDLARNIGLALLPAAFLFFPVFHWGGWYAGRYSTDLFEYSHLSSLLRDNSLINLRGSSDALTSGVLTSGAGFEWRSIDSVLASLVGVTTFSSTMTGLVIVAIALFLLFALCILAFMSRSGVPGILLALLLLLAPPFVALFIENYQSHYFFLALVPGLVLASAVIPTPGKPLTKSDQLYRYLLFCSVVAVAIAVYPYFAVIVFFAIIVSFILVYRQVFFAISSFSKVLLGVLVLLNISVISLFSLGESATRYQSGLDEIARGVLLAPYSAIQLGSATLGITPYIWRPIADPQQYMGWLGSRIWSSGFDAWNPSLTEFIALALFVIVFLGSIEWRVSLKRVRFLASVFIVLGFALLTGLFALNGSPYSALKAGWTAAALLPLVVVCSSLKTRGTALAAIALFPLALLWARTDLLDRSNWIVTREGAESSLSHSSIQPSLNSLRDYLETTSGPVAIIRGRQPLLGSDRDRVLYNHVRITLRDLGIPCFGCNAGEREIEKLPIHGVCDVRPQVVIRIGRSGERSVCGMGRRLSLPTMEIYGK